MYTVKTYNAIAECGLEILRNEGFAITENGSPSEAIVLRSHKLQPEEIGEEVLGIARAGAGVNNVPVDYCSEHGIVVFNTPGANANAVKELVICGLFLASRGIVEGAAYVQGLSDLKGEELNKKVEGGKKAYRGSELAGKTLGVIGLGAIGRLVAESALQLGMNVIGFDPGLSVDGAWRLPNNLEKADNLKTLLKQSDYITLHLPILESTRGLMGPINLKQCKLGARLLNFSRGEIVENTAVIEALESGHLSKYITDFPAEVLFQVPGVVALPHLGASTAEAEDNCARMAAAQLRDFLKNGNIVNSVNYPTAYLERTSEHRIAITNRNIPNMIQQITAILAGHGLNVSELLNKSRGELAYTLVDVDTAPSAEVITALRAIDGVMRVRA